MENFKYVCGIDEAGRGPLAGPVTAACVVLPGDFPVELLNDSKKLSEKKRAVLETLIKEKALAYGIAESSHTEIDEINILQASLLAMQRAFSAMVQMLCEKGLLKSAEESELANIFAIIDGTFVPQIGVNAKAEPKADGKYPEVMAASILAKTCRDREMCEYAKLYPEYGYEKHKGYPTKAHREICQKIGPSPIQRLSFDYKK